MEKYYQKENIEFEAINIGVDHFTLPTDMLTADHFNVTTYRELGVPEDKMPITGYFKLEHLKSYIGNNEKETIVLDLPIGRGKTTSCYDLIKHYAQDEDKIIIVLSPFKKLVEKDYKEIVDVRGVDAFTYKSLSNLPGNAAQQVIEDALTKRVHIMTIHCLLKNPGKDAFAQPGSHTTVNKY